MFCAATINNDKKNSKKGEEERVEKSVMLVKTIEGQF